MTKVWCAIASVTGAEQQSTGTCGKDAMKALRQTTEEWNHCRHLLGTTEKDRSLSRCWTNTSVLILCCFHCFHSNAGWRFHFYYKSKFALESAVPCRNPARGADPAEAQRTEVVAKERRVTGWVFQMAPLGFAATLWWLSTADAVWE